LRLKNFLRGFDRRLKPCGQAGVRHHLLAAPARDTTSLSERQVAGLALTSMGRVERGYVCRCSILLSIRGAGISHMIAMRWSSTNRQSMVSASIWGNTRDTLRPSAIEFPFSTWTWQLRDGVGTALPVGGVSELGNSRLRICRMLWLVEDDCAPAQGPTSWGQQSALGFTFACAVYNLVRMRNLAAAVPAA